MGARYEGLQRGDRVFYKARPGYIRRLVKGDDSMVEVHLPTMDCRVCVDAVDVETIEDHKTRYLIMRSGFFLSGMFDGGAPKFQGIGLKDSYSYGVKAVAEDVARQLGAVVFPISSNSD